MSTEKKQRRCDCSHALRHMCDTLGADLDSPECQAVRAHMNECVNCSAYLDSLKKTVELYATYPVPHIPARVKADLIRSCKAAKKNG